MPGRIVYSTDPARQPCEACGVFPCACPTEAGTLDPSSQSLSVRLDRKGRKGKRVTLVAGFIGSRGELGALCKTLKKHCGSGGSAKEGVIEIQGDQVDQVVNKLRSMGYGARRK